MKLKHRNFYLEFFIGIIVIYASVLILLFIFQRSLMYHPLENNYSGDKLNVEVEKVKILTSDNINLLGWFHKKDLNKFKTIVYFHGNAGNLENRIHKLNHFKNINVNFLITFEFFINNEYVNGKINKTTTVHLQNANEIGGTCSTPPLATIKLEAIKIGWMNKSEKAKKLFFLLDNFLLQTIFYQRKLRRSS